MCARARVCVCRYGNCKHSSWYALEYAQCDVAAAIVATQWLRWYDNRHDTRNHCGNAFQHFDFSYTYHIPHTTLNWQYAYWGTFHRTYNTYTSTIRLNWKNEQNDFFLLLSVNRVLRTHLHCLKCIAIAVTVYHVECVYCIKTHLAICLHGVHKILISQECSQNGSIQWACSQFKIVFLWYKEANLINTVEFFEIQSCPPCKSMCVCVRCL